MTKATKMKINKKYLIFRILTFPIKFIFTMFWHILIGINFSISWLLFGAQELNYGKDGKDSLVKLIEQNKKIIEHLKL